MAPTVHPASRLRNYYQINRYGDPIAGTNVRINKKPTSFGKGQRWVEFVPVNQAQPCCTTGRFTVTSIGKKWRYYVRLRNTSVIDELPAPIPGTLEKHMWPPTQYGWQEVIGRYQCETSPQFNVTAAITDDPHTFHLLTDLNLDPAVYELVAGSGPTDGALMTYNLLSNGTMVVHQDNAAVDSTDTITLQYTNGDCLFAFQMTFVYTAP